MSVRAVLDCDPACPFAEPELWAVVEQAPTYEISSYGRLRRRLPDGSTRPITLARNDSGYRKANLGWRPCPPGCDQHRKGRRAAARRRGHLRQEYAHRLVWQAFRGPIPDGLTVNHHAGGRVDRLAGLELMTRSENTADRWERWRATKSGAAA